MRAHVIENGFVVNTIEVKSLDFMPNLVEATEGTIGWLYDGEKFSPPPEKAPEVPAYITMRQCRLQLLAINKLADVDSAIAAIPDATQRQSAQIEWEYSAVVERSSSWVNSLGASLGLTNQQLDELFIMAAKL